MTHAIPRTAAYNVIQYITLHYNITNLDLAHVHEENRVRFSHGNNIIVNL